MSGVSFSGIFPPGRVPTDGLRTTNSNRGTSRPPSSSLRATRGPRGESGTRGANPVARSRLFFSQRPSTDGEATIHLVPGHRSHSAKIRAQHLAGGSDRLCFSNPAHILHSRQALAPGV